MAVDRHGARGDVVEAGEQAEDRALAGAARADEGGHRPGGDREADVVEVEPVPGIAEGDVREANLPCQPRERLRSGRVDHPGALSEQVFHALQTPGGGDEARDDLLGQAVGILVDARKQAREGDQRADRQPAVEGEQRPRPERDELHEEHAKA